jgi:hypothetical protein
MMGVTYRVPDLSGRRVLLAGLGGGCDIFTAHAFRQVLAGAGAADFIDANAKRPDRCGPTCGALSPHVLLAPGVQDGINEPADGGMLSHSLILVVPAHGDERSFVDEVRGLGCDFIFGIDAGGDSLAPAALSGPEGRDKLMLRLLRQVGLPLHHVVVAPGCDGETTADALAKAMSQEAARSRYRGCFSLEPLYPDLRRLAVGLTSERTPCIMLAAAARLTAGARPDDTMLVERDRKPEIPLAWLTRGFVFERKRASSLASGSGVQ